MSKKVKDNKKSSKSSRKHLLKWLDSFEQVSAAVEKHGDLLHLLKAGGGICKIQNFLPQFVAEGIYEMLENFTEAEWNVTAADDDYTLNNISHEFLSTKSQTLEAIFRVFTLLLPDALFTFSAAKYCRQGHIKPHDDRAYTQVRMDDGSIQICSRNIAVIYYLTKDWTAHDGGLLIDHEAPGGPQTHIPKFNSVISFLIPRWHEVTPVVGNRPRYSVFGWFLEPGQLYELQLNPQLPSQEQLQQRHKQNTRENGADKAAAAAAEVAANGEQPSQGQLQQGAKHKKSKKHTSSGAAANGGHKQADEDAGNAAGAGQKHTQHILQQTGNTGLRQQSQQQPAPQPKQHQQQQQQPAAARMSKKQTHALTAGSIASRKPIKPHKQQLPGVQKLKNGSKHKKGSKSKSKQP